MADTMKHLKEIKEFHINIVCIGAILAFSFVELRKLWQNKTQNTSAYLKQQNMEEFTKIVFKKTKKTEFQRDENVCFPSIIAVERITKSFSFLKLLKLALLAFSYCLNELELVSSDISFNSVSP